MTSIADLPVIAHANAFAHVLDGDLAFVSGASPLSRTIRRVTDSDYSHVGLMFWQEKRLVLYEAVRSGVRAVRVSRKLEECAALLFARHAGLDEWKKTLLFHGCLDNLGVPYDTAELARIYARIRAIGPGKPHINEALICSEFVHRAFARAGIDLVYNPLGFITPSDIASQVQFMGRIVL